MIKKLFLGILVILLTSACTTTKPQAPAEPVEKTVVVSADTAFSEKIQLPFDDKGQTLTVGVEFDEASNIVTVKLAGTRSIMVFQQDIRYKDVFTNGCFLQRKLRAEKLPYPVLVQPYTNYYMKPSVYNKYAKKRKQHLFNAWIDYSDGNMVCIDTLNASQQLVPDTLVKRFKVAKDAVKCGFKLRNIFTLDPKSDKYVAPAALKRNIKMKNKLVIVNDKDLNTIYHVQLRRNPCFYSVAMADSVNARCKKLKAAYKRLRLACPEGKANSETEVGVFNQHRQFLLSQFLPMEEKSDCTDLQDAYNTYNAYVDSITKAPCCYHPVKEKVVPEASMGLDSQMLLNAAHKIDDMVSQILVTKDPMEVYDLISTTNNFIRSVDDQIAGKPALNDAQRQALKAYHKAVSFYKSNVSK